MVTEQPDPRPAGRFGPWLDRMHAALTGDGEADVPCGGCTACCTSAQFVHVAPDEVDSLAVIPAELLAAAPGMPTGHVVIGYDERGHCPLLVDGRCSVYAHRPRACRTYDCRVFAATGVQPDQPQVAEIARRWHFDVATPDEQDRWDALHAAAAAPGPAAGEPPTARALRALAGDRGSREGGGQPSDSRDSS